MVVGEKTFVAVASETLQVSGLRQWDLTGTVIPVSPKRVWSSVVFFFSSRRRHTRCSRDWSSDVCSSDLAIVGRHVPADMPVDMLLAGTDRGFCAHAKQLAAANVGYVHAFGRVAGVEVRYLDRKSVV